MLDDRKHSEAVKAFFTEREFIDLCRIAAREDRKPGELVRVIVRRSMYGTIGAESSEGNGANRADGAANESLRLAQQVQRTSTQEADKAQAAPACDGFPHIAHFRLVRTGTA